MRTIEQLSNQVTRLVKGAKITYTENIRLIEIPKDTIIGIKVWGQIDGLINHYRFKLYRY